ncbi:MAG TPA: hypothetical protein VFQ82_02035 [Stellaceae bacterium]|nr:hypothetical protein [Stellaceae bacterium]
MADIRTSVVISAQTGELQSGIAAAASAVQNATDAMRAQFASLGAAADKVHSQIAAAAAQIGATVGSLQSRTAGLAGAVGGSVAAGGSGISGTAGSRVGEWRAALQQQLIAEQKFFGDSRVEELAFWQEKLALTTAGSKEQLAVENNIFQLEKQLAAERERDALGAIGGAQKIADADLARQRAAIEGAASIGRISAAQEIAEEQSLADRKWEIDQEYFQKKLSAADGDAKTQEKLNEQELLEYEKYLTDKQKLDDDAIRASQRAWQSIVAPIESAIDKSVTGIIIGTTTVQRAVANLAQSVLGEFVSAGVKSLFGALIGTATGGGAENGLFGGLLSGIFGRIFGGLFGGSADFDAFGGIGAASESGGGLLDGLFAGIGSLFAFAKGGVVPSAQGGWAVPTLGPGGVLAQLHSNEMVLPANISQGLQTMLADGGSGHTFNIGINALDSVSVARLFASNGSVLVAALNKALRNGASLYAGALG